MAEGIDAYEADLKAHGGSRYNASMIRRHLPDTLASKPVALLTEKELLAWRAGLIKKGLKPSSAERIAKVFKAALALAAANDKRITNTEAWTKGLRKPEDENDEPRNIILPDATVTAVVRGCYEEDHDFGLIIDVLAETGARESQLFRLRVDDLQDHLAAPRLMMPSSRKGKNRKRNRTIKYKPLPISPRLAKALRQHAKGRAPDTLLFDRLPKMAARFKPVAKRLELGERTSPYSLRHSSIVRMILQHVPLRVIASHHDTSTWEIERTYSRFITGDATEAMTRATLLDPSAPSSADVIPLARHVS